MQYWPLASDHSRVSRMSTLLIWPLQKISICRDALILLVVTLILVKLLDLIISSLCTTPDVGVEGLSACGEGQE